MRRQWHANNLRKNKKGARLPDSSMFRLRPLFTRLYRELDTGGVRLR